MGLIAYVSSNGVVVIAGLGLGHQLMEVCKKRSVKKIILLERSRELVDWLLPRMRPHLSGCKLEVVIGDAREETGKVLEAVEVMRLDDRGRETYRDLPLTHHVLAAQKKHAERRHSRGRKPRPWNFALDDDWHVLRKIEIKETLLLKLGNRPEVNVVLADIYPHYGGNTVRLGYDAPTGGRRPGVVWWAWGGGALR